MAKINYAFTDDKKTAKALGRSLKISPKHAVEICNRIRGMKVENAKNYLEDVIEMKKAVPLPILCDFKRFPILIFLHT